MLTAHEARRGATLIEFLIAFSILGILVATAIPSFRDWIVNSQVRTAADTINSGLQLARTEAVRRNTRVRWTLVDSAGGSWVVNVPNTGATIQRRSGNEGTASALVTSTQNDIVFNGVGWVTPTPGAAIQIDVSNPDAGACQSAGGGGGPIRCLRLLVGIGGQVRMCDPALGSSAAAAC